MNRRRELYIVLVFTFVFSLITVTPRQIYAQTARGVDLYNSWEYKEAEVVLRDAVKADPQDITANFYLGLSILLQEKYNEALGIFQKVNTDWEKADAQARSSMPDEYQIQIALARTYLGLGKLDDAWKCLETAGNLNASLPDVYVYRGAYYIQKNDNEKAIENLERAISLDEKNVYAHYYAGHAYLRSGNPARAVEMFKIFISLAPGAPEVPKAKALVDALC